MNFTNQIDDELCKSIIEKRDLLLSSNSIDQSSSIGNDQISIDFFSMLDNESVSMNLVDLSQTAMSGDSNFDLEMPVNNETYQQITNEQLGIKDEIIGKQKTNYYLISNV